MGKFLSLVTLGLPYLSFYILLGFWFFCTSCCTQILTRTAFLTAFLGGFLWAELRGHGGVGLITFVCHAKCGYKGNGMA